MRPSKRISDGTQVALLAWTILMHLTFGAQAAVTISSAATQNMSCSNGTCAPTANKAVLNVGDLETLLGSSSVTVTTTGTGVQASNIYVKSALSWSGTNLLSLLAKRSVEIDQALTVAGQSGLTIQIGQNGTFSFGKKGNVSFANLSSQLTINGSAFTLAGDVKTLAAAIASNPSGNFALANSYNASGDGTYMSSPVPTVLTGTFDGLGNAVSNLSIEGGTELDSNVYQGLFAGLGTLNSLNGTIRNIGLIGANIFHVVKAKYVWSGSLVGRNCGTITNSYATGNVKNNQKSLAGGLVADNMGIIAYSHSAANVTGGLFGIGGLAATNEGTISDSYSTGKISAGSGGRGSFDEAGGLVGYNYNTIENSYATGIVTGGNEVSAGGLAGINLGSIISSYSTGAVEGKTDSYVGGFVGNNGVKATISFSYSIGTAVGGSGSFVGGLIGDDGAPAGSLDDTYWDTDTSGITDPSQGAGNIANDPGITGLTTEQFQSGLPAGFDPNVWAEKANVIDGLPYLLANPPPK